ncbi:MAG TPA: hypothetical protein VMT42_03895 [candidate division Zixibacteria bacterium]|nr:hypothetical protein [candidate division Zixibacteria bacterium]
MIEKVETRAGNAHRVILSNNGNFFYVSSVRVHLCKGSTKHQATFCAREANDGQSKELTMKIPQNLYDVLLEYVRLNNPDLLLVLQVEGDEFKWGFTSETRLKQYSCKDNYGKYVV